MSTLLAIMSGGPGVFIGVFVLYMSALLILRHVFHKEVPALVSAIVLGTAGIISMILMFMGM